MAWRQFQLFDTIPIRDPNYRSNDQLYSDLSLSAIGGSSNYLVIAVKLASLKVINKQMEAVGEFQAYDWDYRITFVKSVPNSDLVRSSRNSFQVPYYGNNPQWRQFIPYKLLSVQSQPHMFGHRIHEWKSSSCSWRSYSRPRI